MILWVSILILTPPPSGCTSYSAEFLPLQTEASTVPSSCGEQQMAEDSAVPRTCMAGVSLLHKWSLLLALLSFIIQCLEIPALQGRLGKDKLMSYKINKSTNKNRYDTQPTRIPSFLLLGVGAGRAGGARFRAGPRSARRCTASGGRDWSVSHMLDMPRMESSP